MHKKLSPAAAFFLAAALFLLLFSGCDAPTNNNGCGSTGTDSATDTNTDSGSSSGSSAPETFQAVTSEYTYKGVTAANSSYKDSAHFRIYYGGSRLANVSDKNLNIALAHLEAAYKQFVTDRGFRSPGLSVHSDNGPYYKMNVYPSAVLAAGGYMRYDSRSGLSYLEILSSQLTLPQVIVHEFGHALTLTEYGWVDQTSTGAWWETVANWVADSYITSSYYEDVKKSYGLSKGTTLINLNKNISMSYLTIVHDQNYYEAWPFLTYLTNNPDDYTGLGKTVVTDMFRNHLRNDETPLHVLERITSPTSVQTVLGRYWARMAYLDIGHEQAQTAFFNNRRNLDFSNLTAKGNQTYQVKSARKPMYGGANIIPLKVSGGQVAVEVTNLGNGLSDSNFTATLAVRSASGAVRYVDLPDGVGQASVESGEEASLVVVNTPDNVYQYNAFKSNSSSPECIGLNYQVQLTGATPAY